VYKKHRLKHYTREFNDVKEKVNKMFKKFQKYSEVAKWREHQEEME